MANLSIPGLIILLCISASHQCTRDTKRINLQGENFTITYSVDKKNLYYTYALCNSENQLHRCNLNIERETMNKFDDEQMKKKSCNVNFHTTGITNFLNKLLQIDEDKIVFVYQKEDERQECVGNRACRNEYGAIVIDMLTCTVMDSVVFLADKFVPLMYTDEILVNINIVPYTDGSFDLVFPYRRLCGNEHRCRISYSSEAKKFVNPNEPSKFLRIELPSPVMIEAILNKNPEDTQSYLVSSENFGVEGQLIQIQNSDGEVIFNNEFDTNYRKSVFAGNEEHVGICEKHIYKKLVQCKTMDGEGRVVSKSTILLNTTIHVAQIYKLHNMPNNEFVLPVIYRKSMYISSIKFLWIDQNGNVKTSFDMPNVKCYDTPILMISTVNKKTFCARYLCPEVKRMNSDFENHLVNVQSKCFTARDEQPTKQIDEDIGDFFG